MYIVPVENILTLKIAQNIEVDNEVKFEKNAELILRVTNLQRYFRC